MLRPIINLSHNHLRKIQPFVRPVLGFAPLRMFSTPNDDEPVKPKARKPRTPKADKVENLEEPIKPRKARASKQVEEQKP